MKASTFAKNGPRARRLARGFDGLAGAYDLLNYLFLGSLPLRASLTLLDSLPLSPRAAVIGGGTGRFALKLAETRCVHELLCADLSGAMLERTRARLDQGARRRDFFPETRFPRGGPECLPADQSLDLLCTNYFLDLFSPDELEEVLTRLDQALRPGGLWYFCDYVSQGAGPLARLRLRVAYAFFRLTCGISARRIPDYEAGFRARGYRRSRTAYFARGPIECVIFQKPR